MPLGVGSYAAKGSGSRGLQLEEMTPEEEESWLSSLARNTGSAIETLGLALDTPGAIARGILAGEPTSGFNWDYDKRVSGEDLLKSYGILSNENKPWRDAAAGFAAELATDPFAIVTTPMASLTKAGKAARAAGILDLAPVAAQAKMGAAAKGTMTGRMAESALDSLLPRGLAKTPENYAIRPLVGPRLARTKATLDDVVQAANDPTDALDKVTKYLTNKGLDYDAVKDERLGGAFGLGFFSPMATFTPSGSDTVLDAMDAAGQALAWSRPVRQLSGLLDERVAGTTDMGDQIAALRQWKALDSARATGRREAARHAETVTQIPMSDRAKQLLGADSLLSEQGNDFLTRVFENKPTAADRVLMRELPGINNAVASWDRLRQANVAQAKTLGLGFTELKDPRFGVAYSPRSGTELDFGEYGTGFGRSMFESRVSEEMSRNPSLYTPGGTTDLREVSKIPIVREWAKDGANSRFSVAQVGAEISNYINRKHNTRAIDQSQGEAIAGVMRRLNKDLPNDVPIFAAHPLNEQTRVIINQEVARANARFVYESLAEAAVGIQANQIPGAGFRRLDTSANDIAGRVGLATGAAGLDPAVQKQIVDRVAAKMGVNPAQVDLSKLAIPEQVYNRLSRIQDFYSSPRAQQEVSGMFDSLTQFWKASILAFPARHVRDAYSNAFSVWLETGDPIAVKRGFGVAKQILAGDIEGALPKLAKLPQYQGIADPNALRSKVMGDIAASGIMTGLSQSDVLAARRSGELSRILPGLQPVSRGAAFRELLPDGSRNPLQMASDFVQIKGLTNQFETRNPILNWSQKLSDANDSIARLGGWIALLSKGVSPQQAAERMHKALVNYEGLTSFERNVLRKIFPWYAYTSRIGKYALQSMLENPGGTYAQTIRGMNVFQQPSEETYLPARLRQQLSVRIPDEWLAAVGIQQTPGTQTVLSDLDLPAVDALSMFNPYSIQETIRNLFSQTNPFIKGVAEIAFDEDLFSKRKLRDSDPAVNKVYRYFTGDNLSPIAKVIGSNIPGTQRAIGMAAGLLDDRYDMSRNLPKTLLNSAAGFKVVDVDEKWKNDDILRSLEQQIAPVTGSFTRSFIDKEKLAQASPEEQRLALLYQIMEQRARKEKKAAQAKPFVMPSLGI